MVTRALLGPTVLQRPSPRDGHLLMGAPKIPFLMQPPEICSKGSRAHSESKSERRLFELKKITFILGTNKIMVNIYK